MGTQRSPGRKRVTFEPTAETTPTPSWPGEAGSSGARGYLPSIVLISEGLIGACRKGTVGQENGKFWVRF